MGNMTVGSPFEPMCARTGWCPPMDRSAIVAAWTDT